MNRADNQIPAFATTRLFRRLVLGIAFFLGLAIALAPRSPSVYAQEPKSPAAPPAAQTAPDAPKSSGPKSLSIKDGRGAEIKIDVGEGGRTSVTESSGADSGAEADTPRKKGARKQARVTIDGVGVDREFDSFDEFVHDEPALAAMVIGIVSVVFFAPVLAIALILWYRMRKARMLNETMLKLAEKGIIPSADAIGALAGGKQAAAAAPYYEQAKQVRRQAAWSDLRKGVLVGGVGLAISLHSLFQSRSPNVVGLVLLFVGLGFVVLWWFEQRHLLPQGGGLRDTAPGAVPRPPDPPPT